MEQAEILARLAKAREFEKITANGWIFKLRLPSAFVDRRLAYEIAELPRGGQAQQWIRGVLLTAVVGWSGPTLDDVLHEGDKTPLPFAPALVGALLDEHIEVFDELSTAVNAERKARTEKAEATAKNSASASTGS